MSLEIGLLPVLHALIGSIRILVMMMAGPLFSHPSLSTRMRLIGALMIAWVAGPVGVGGLAGSDWDAMTVASAVLVEVMIGLSVGVGAGLIFAGILQLGEFAGIQGGLGAARSIDPASGASSVAVGMAFNTFAMMIFLVIGGHHDLIRGITISFAALPVGGSLPTEDVFLGIARLGGVIWKIAFQLAAPITVAIFVQNIATGLLGRAMPQLNLLIVNLPLHVGMLLLIIGLGAGDFIHGFKDVIEFWPSQVFGIVMGGANGG